MAIRHLVLLQFKPNTPPETIASIMADFERTALGIDGVEGFEGGPDISKQGRAKGFTHVFSMYFESEALRDAYLDHPDHVAFVERLQVHMADALVVDYEAAEDDYEDGGLLRFPLQAVDELVHHAKNAAGYKPLEGEETGPGLWLVGDEGVYLMSNGVPGLMADGTPEKSDDEEGERFVVYAEGIDPHSVPEGVWLARRQAAFGNEIGMVFIPLDEVEDGLEEMIEAGEHWFELEAYPEDDGEEEE